MFSFNGYEINRSEGKIAFKYELAHEGETFSFAEKISFDPKQADFKRAPDTVLTNALDTLSLILGISYWKLFCPKELRLPNIALTSAQAQFWNTVYTKGLGEFFYKNKIDFRGLVNFPTTSGAPGAPEPVPNTGRSLVLWGGGKDSIVTAELFKKEKKDFDLFSLNDYSIQRETAKIAGKDLLIFKREIDPLLLELNKRPGVYNGHVPVSVVYSATALLAALLYGYDSVVISCEESANYGNVEYLGESINHQWSKSEEFEKMFSRYIARYITPSVDYHSALRKYSELEITALFSKYPQYFFSFSSCNKNFTIEKNKGGLPARTSVGGWCGECPKCAFVFAMLAAYIPKETVVKIFGKNLFNEPALTTIYRSLLGRGKVKPFDCVGTPEETVRAFELARQKGEYAEDVIMKEYETIRA
ncbi:MAG: endonuclease domain-containing protein [Patescibacteria group bacterium]